MPLVDLKTDLTKLRFGSPDIPGDRPGGTSWSREPFIKGKPLNLRIENDGIETLGRTGGPDMFIRGGLQVASSVADDLLRLGRYFTTVEGGLFWAQQNVLSAVGVKIYGGYPITITEPNRRRLNGGTYTPLSTLAAAAGVAIGGHPNKQGIDFTGTSTTLSLPQYINLVDGNLEGLKIEALSIKEKANNRLVNLYKGKITNSNSIGDEELYSYLGGPNSGKYGNNFKTIIKIAKDRTQISGRSPSDAPISVTYSTFSQDQISNRTPIGDGPITTATDFRKELLFKPKSYISDSPDYKTENIEQRVNLGDPGKRNVDRSNYTKGRPDNVGGMDKINSLYLYKSENVTTDSRKNDLVKFRIAVIDNDNPTLKTFAHFRAFINSFNNNMSSNWSSFKYAGRGEDFFTYNGFSEQFSLSFTVMAQSIQELSIMYQKLNYIKSSLAPNYSKSGYMRGNIAQLTMGGYLYEMPGIIESFNITIPNDTPWEIGIPATAAQDTNAIGSNEFTDSAVKELPHRLEVSMDFKPIYKFLPETVKNINGGRSITQRFISLEDANGDDNTLYADGINSRFKPAPGTLQVPSEDLPTLTYEGTELEVVPEEDDGFEDQFGALDLFNQINPTGFP
ncbi:hypothetical protein OAA18_00300 [bacterium]|nr:hypothetical protein [bacterium]